ncbi:MAG TPA: L-serine ammonia-lyase, iron-sulfur-dependent, subunit alpha [Candidatus Gemmiger faecigallinarum]|nr:L-serine ammonia-lyase, iron-sulfur-dependent, subunit alpha [Candidatus Gemmiger faecigallinarum]
MDNKNLIDLLVRENVPSLGCTEPMAIAYASALAVELLGGGCDTLTLYVSPNILKNAMGVGIPGSTLVGGQIAAALAWVAGTPAYGLEVLRDVTPKDEQKARRLLEKGLVRINLADTDKKLYIRAVAAGGGNEGSVVICGQHTHVAERRKNGVLVSSAESESETETPDLPALTLEQIWNFIHDVPARDLEFLQAGIDMNLRAAEEGLRNPYGLQLGRRLLDRQKSAGGSDPFLAAAALAAAAADARMAGCRLPVMTVTGSGNQGIATILPAAVLARRRGADQARTLRAVALCQLVAIEAKQYTGRLSALCGAVNAAAAGVACAAVYLYGGSLGDACRAVQNVAGNVAGLICDGAKSSCSLKIVTGVLAAMQAAMLALHGSAVGGQDGIVSPCAEDTLKNLGRLANQGMQTTDQVILQIMLEKQSRP